MKSLFEYLKRKKLLYITIKVIKSNINFDVLIIIQRNNYH